MYPILGRYGSFFLYSYTAVLGLGLVMGVGLVWWQRWREKRPFSPDPLLLAIALALLLGRASFVWAQWGYFQQRPAESWQLWQGGLTYHGALCGGLIGAWLGKKQLPLPLLALPLALLHAAGWAACLLEGCAYGRPTTLSLLAADLPDDFGVYALRYQTQLLGVLASLLLLAGLLWATGRWGKNCRFFPLTLLLTTLIHLSLTLLRGDPSPQLGPLRLDTLLDGGVVLLSLFLLQYQQKVSLWDFAGF